MMTMPEIADLCDKVADDIKEAAEMVRELNTGTAIKLMPYERRCVEAAIKLAAIESVIDIP